MSCPCSQAIAQFHTSKAAYRCCSSAADGATNKISSVYMQDNSIVLEPKSAWEKICHINSTKNRRKFKSLHNSRVSLEKLRSLRVPLNASPTLFNCQQCNTFNRFSGIFLSMNLIKKRNDKFNRTKALAESIKHKSILKPQLTKRSTVMHRNAHTVWLRSTPSLEPNWSSAVPKKYKESIRNAQIENFWWHWGPVPLTIIPNGSWFFFHCDDNELVCCLHTSGTETDVERVTETCNGPQVSAQVANWAHVYNRFDVVVTLSGNSTDAWEKIRNSCAPIRSFVAR